MNTAWLWHEFLTLWYFRTCVSNERLWVFITSRKQRCPNEVLSSTPAWAAEFVCDRECQQSFINDHAACVVMIVFLVGVADSFSYFLSQHLFIHDWHVTVSFLGFICVFLSCRYLNVFYRTRMTLHLLLVEDTLALCLQNVSAVCLYVCDFSFVQSFFS